MSASIGAIIASQPALAQSAQNDASEDGDRGEIIVTARRSNENLQNVPVAVSVLSGDELAKQRITGARDLQYSTPSLVVTNDPLGGSTTPVFQLRGQVAAQGSDDTVVTYVADVPIDARAFAGGLFDLESVQVVRGPQGTLFGKNSTGGAVIFTPRKANTDAIGGFIEGTYGNYNYYQVGAGLNLPVIEGKLGLRVSGQVTRQDGFTKNLSGPDGADKHYEVLRVSLVATPTENLRNETFFSYFHGRQHQNPLIWTNINNGLLSFLLGSTAALPQADFAKQQTLGPRTIDYSFRPNNDDNDVYIVTNTTSLDLGSVTLKNIFGYINMKPRLSLSQSSSNFPLVDVIQNKDKEQISNELQLSGDTGSLKWIVGGFISREVTKTHQDSYVFGAPNAMQDNSDRYNSKALFGQATYDFSSAGLNGVKFTAGLRHTWDNRTGVLNSKNFSFSTFTYVQQPILNNTRSYKNWSWTLGLDYQVTPDLLLYVTSRHSYKAGGLNLITNIAPLELITFEPEKLTDIEAGVKATIRTGDAVIHANLAAYRGWYKNMQFQQLSNCFGQVGSYVVNAAKGSPKGLEFEVDASITKNFRVGGFYNRTLGKFDRFQLVQPAGCSTIGFANNLNGADFGNIAKDSVGLNASYTLPLDDDGQEMVLSGNFYHRGNKVGSITAGNNASIPGYSVLNLRLDYNNIAGTGISAGVWARNLTDELYSNYRNDVRGLTGYDSIVYAEPRTYGIDLKYKF